MSVGQRIWQVRKKFNLTQEEFAKRLGIKRGYVSSIEINAQKPSDTLLKHIMHEYGISDAWLTTGQGAMFISPEDALKNQIARFGERAFINAFNNIMKEHNLTVANNWPLHHTNADTRCSELNRLIDTLYLLWSTGDDRFKNWISVQFDIAYPKQVVEDAQKKQKDISQASAG